MRHLKEFNHLGRTRSHRKAMLANMASSLILHKRITTTTAKAKALRMYVEPLITKSKEDSTHSRRVVFSYLKNKFAVSELFREVSPKIASRPGGYTRILKTGTRLGDNADMCIIELVDYNENMLSETGTKAKSTRRRRGGSKKKTEGAAAEVTETTTKKTVEEAVESESVMTDSDKMNTDSAETAPEEPTAEGAKAESDEKETEQNETTVEEKIDDEGKSGEPVAESSGEPGEADQAQEPDKNSSEQEEKKEE